MARVFEYAIVRLTSQAHRGEQINIGIVVFKDESLDMRFYPAPYVAKILGVDLADIEWLPELISDLDVASEKAVVRHAKIAGLPGILLSDVGWFIADDEDQYEARLTTLKTSFIDRPISVRPPTRKKHNLASQVKRKFIQYEIMGNGLEDIDRHRIVSNVPVGPSEKLKVDFLVRNGAFHATETLDFRRSVEAGASELKQAALASCTLEYAREKLGQNGTRCYFVYAASSVSETPLRPALQLAQRHVDDSFNLESREDEARYYDLMLDAAGSTNLFSR